MSEILFLAHRAPWPPDRGDRIRSWHMLAHLARLAHVHVAAFADNAADRATALPKLENITASHFIRVRQTSRAQAALHALPRRLPMSVGLFHDAAMAQHVERLLNVRPISHIVAFSGQMAQYVPASFGGNFLMDFVDVDSAKFESYARDDAWWQPMRLVHAWEAWRLARWEEDVAHRAQFSLLVSEAEANLFRSRARLPARRVHAIGNGIDMAHFHTMGGWQPLDAATRGAGPLLCFTGQMDYRPNVDAVRRFALEILPLIRADFADARFAIVGRSPNEAVRALANLPGVIVTGEVPDTRPWLAAADVVVAPLNIARGVQNKLLEAMSMARPVVASPQAVEGLSARAPAELLVADSNRETALAIKRLLTDADTAAAMGRAARARVVSDYSWQAALRPMDKLLGLAPKNPAVTGKAAEPLRAA